MRVKKYSRLVKFGVLAFSILFAAFVIITFSSIYCGVKKNCQKARSQFPGGCQEALIQYIESENYSLKERNSAIWALGQLADPRSVEFLEQLDTSVPPSGKCQHDKYLCSYEIQKALKWSKNGNWTSWMYRNQENW